MVSKQVAAERNPRIVKRWISDRVSLREIADEFEMTPAGVRLVLVGEGVWTDENYLAFKQASSQRKRESEAAAKHEADLKDPVFLRNQEILSKWNAGNTTLESLGQEHGITRERVRQIVSTLGGANSKVVRSMRSEKRSAQISAQANDFLVDNKALLKKLQGQGRTGTQVRESLEIMYPDVSPIVIERAIKNSRLVYKQSDVAPLFTDDAIRVAVWHAIGVINEATAHKSDALTLIAPETMTEITKKLEAQDLDDVSIQEAFLRAAGGMQFAKENPDTSIPHARYESVRDDFLESNGLSSEKGVMLWPPTRQTVMKRLGNNSWSDSLRSLGLGTSSMGRAKGQLQFEAEDFAAAIRDFLSHSRAYGKNATYAAYEAWVKRERASNRKRPSGASIRNVFGSWISAVQAEGDPASVGILTRNEGSK